jgi:DUF1680 family protein
MPISADRLQPAPLKAVTIEDRFWRERIRVNRETTIPIEYQQCLTTGRIKALTLAQVPEQHIFWDSDVAKWIEAAAYSLATHPDPAVEALLDEVIGHLARAQQPDGYLNTYFITVAPEKRWTNLRDDHELYCAGHLMEAAVAHFQATGKTTFLDIMRRYADYIGTVFGPELGQKRGYCGHEEIELALVKMAEATDEGKYQALAQYFVDERGRQPHYFDQEAEARGEDPKGYHFSSYGYNQSHLPVREQSQVIGHSVRGMYLYAAMADLAARTHDEALQAACERIWNHLTSAQMYVTGGIGGFASNEGYGDDFDLPNETAYAETCAAIGLVFWASRMLQTNCDRRYADVMERALYNGVLSGVSLDGTKFFYDNPLASVGKHHRQDWFGCACCPPNIARLLASFGQYAYSQSATDLAVHLYVQSHADLTVAGQSVTLSQTTDYPWDGTVLLTVSPEQPASFRLRLRLPEWCRAPHLSINGKSITPTVEHGYAILERLWVAGDTLTLDLPMPVERVSAHPKVHQNRGRVALQRGPVVYCLESADNGEDLDALSLPRTAALEPEFEAELLGGVTVLRGQFEKLSEAAWDGTLYQREAPTLETTRVTAVPYFAWDNRDSGEMQVWVREEASQLSRSTI